MGADFWRGRILKMEAILKGGPKDERVQRENRPVPLPHRYHSGGLMILIIRKSPAFLPIVPGPGLVSPLNKG